MIITFKEFIQFVSIKTLVNLFINSKLEFEYREYSDVIDMKQYYDYSITFIMVEDNVLKIHIEKE